MEAPRFQVFISSTVNDLADERAAVWQELTNLNYIVAGMESFPATAEEQLIYIKNQIDQSDYVVLILGGRYGTVSKYGKSFTEWEFDYAVEIGVPVLVFPVVDAEDRAAKFVDTDIELKTKLLAFRERSTSDRNCKFWATKEELASGVAQGLRYAEQLSPRPGWHRGASIDVASIVRENEELRVKAAKYDSLQGRAIRQTDATKRITDELDRKHTATFDQPSTKKVRTREIRLRDILICIPVTGELDRDVIDSACRYAISDEGTNRKAKLSVDDIELYNFVIDSAILIMSKLDIIVLENLGEEVEIRPSKNWALAHQMAREL